MLEVRHLLRTYKVKNADPVYALNDASLKFPENGLVFILGKSGSGKSNLLNVMGGLDKAEDGARKLTINNSEVVSAESYGSMIAILTQVFLYVGIALAVFSMLLFYNFISVSINNKKREIGILRAVGAKRSDVFKIFYSEALIIASFNFILSSVATFAVSIVLNNSFKNSTNLSFTIMNPNVLVVLLLLGVSLLTSLISSALPVTKIANKKPIDAIQNR